jgi:hypothetical protein
MDVVIGRIPQIVSTGDQRPDLAVPIEAKVLHVRQPRRSADPNRASGNPRRMVKRNAQVDPPGARVLLLLVPDAHRLPEDLTEGPYRIFLRIVRK